ncbi:hypothetical protein NC653_021716 [Populus alba x Populus x berolinensis]|uniref:Uncharacterized protein n=1 Tax=Populus alba x Populus x berolinensis TaxID=444605 RepID=A0AAD6QES3_9ROSI|nr:hypothetical protein NC653_021716 [Populus alba x Populus x berolinensis]
MVCDESVDEVAEEFIKLKHKKFELSKSMTTKGVPLAPAITCSTDLAVFFSRATNKIVFMSNSGSTPAAPAGKLESPIAHKSKTEALL